MGRVVHFEIPAENPERALKFYETVFGWKTQKWDGPMDYWVVNTGEETLGINGGIMPRHDPNQPLCVTIAVENLDNSLVLIEQNGGTVVVPKMEIPGVGWLAYFKDTEGIIQGVMEPIAQG